MLKIFGINSKGQDINLGEIKKMQPLEFSQVTILYFGMGNDNIK